MTVAFVLQGGASLAATQVGMLRALVEAGIEPDLVVGTSAGALNAVAFAQDPTAAGVERLAALWRKARRRDVFPLGPRTLYAAATGRSDGLVRPDRLRAWLQAGITVTDLQQTAVPVAVVAADAVSGWETVLTDGPALDALLASSAVPGVFPSVPWRGRMLIDGGVAADIPVRAAERLGADVVYVLPRATQAPRARRGALAAALQGLDHLLGATSRDDVLTGRRVFVLPAPVTSARSPFDFGQTASMIGDGYASGRDWLRSSARVPGRLRAVPTAA
jgi:NTE family protein